MNATRRPVAATGGCAVVVVAHPCPDSYCHSLARAAVEGLQARGATVELIDLYALGFRAAMSADEHRRYLDGVAPDDPLAAHHGDLVRAADELVFVYPTWWSGLPAILKGWLERVLVAGVAFDLDPATRRVRPALGSLRRITGISTYGSPRTYIRLINDNGRRTLTRALALICSPRPRRRWLALYSIDTSTDEQRQRFLAQVRQQLSDGAVERGAA